MKLSTKGRYAVMAMADLASHTDASPVPLAEIASRQEISLSYLEQLFARMRRAGIVKAVRGPGGGYRLARAAADTRISDIILSVDEPVDITRCQHQTKGCMESGQRCITHDLWDELSRHIHLYLSSVSLEDVVSSRIAGSASGPRGMAAALRAAAAE